MDIARHLARRTDETLSDDVATALVACHRLEQEYLPWLLERAVVRARQGGWSWARIGRLLGMTAQNANRRFRHLDTLTPPSPAPPDRPRWPENARAERLLLEQTDRHRLAQELARWEASGTDIVPW